MGRAPSVALYQKHNSARPTAAMATCTTLSLATSSAILTNLVEFQRDATKCDVCRAHLGEQSYAICRNPDPDPDARDTGGQHEQHSACVNCVKSLAYIGEAAACVVCLDALGGRRSAVRFAGVALRPAVKNGLANRMIRGFKDAEESLEQARDQRDAERLQEGVERRGVAVEEVRRRRQEAEALKGRLEEEARLAKERGRPEGEEVVSHPHEDTRSVEGALETTEEEATEEEANLLDYCEVRDRTLRQPVGKPTRKKRAMSEGAREQFRKKRKQDALIKRAKLEGYDALAYENAVLRKKLARTIEVSKDWMVDRLECGEWIDLFTCEVDTALEEVEASHRDDQGPIDVDEEGEEEEE